MRFTRLIPPVVGACLALTAAPAYAGRCGSQPCRADMDISGHAEPQPVYLGEASSFKFTAKNDGYDGALSVELQATIPSGLRIMSIRRFGGNRCTARYGFLDCQFGDFAREQEALVRVIVCAMKVGTWLAPAKVYASDIVDPNGGNNQVTATLMVKPPPPHRHYRRCDGR